MKSLFLTPPLAKLITAYPATAYITGFLRKKGYDVAHRDMAIVVSLSMLTTKSIDTILDTVEDNYADFEVSRYGERLVASNPSFDDLYATL